MMVASSAIIKKTAKTLMRGKWIRYCVLSLVPIFLTLSCVLISELYLYSPELIYTYWAMAVLLGVFLLAPLYLGTLRVFWRMYMGVDDDIVTLFYYFGDITLYKRALGLIFRSLARLVGFGTIFSLPAIVTRILSSNKFYDTIGFEMPEFAASLGVVSNVFSVLGLTITLFVVLRWYLAPFFFVADEGMEPAEAMHMANVMSKCTYVDFISLIICCLHWILLCTLCLPAPVTLPYLMNIYLVHARFATAKYNNTVEQLTNNDSQVFAVG